MKKLLVPIICVSFALLSCGETKKTDSVDSTKVDSVVVKVDSLAKDSVK
jgi:hypothetical protein